MAVGEYNGTVFLIGGAPSGGVDNNQLVQVDIETQNVTDRGGDFFNVETRGGSQFWTQQSHIVYMITGTTENTTFNTFNLITMEYTRDWRGITFPIDVGEYPTACLASSNAFLYAVGGMIGAGWSIDVVQVLSLSTYSWITDPDPPPMQKWREGHACIVHNNYLWVFGGYDEDGDHATNERIKATNITENTWQFIDSFSVGLFAIRAVSWHDVIYIIGGWDSASVKHDWVHVVDANTGTITISLDNLPYPNTFGSPLIVNGIFYVFGGHWNDTESTYSRDWFYYTLPPFIGSTHAPTSNPTSLTSDPSIYPIAASTSDPTSGPSIYPTVLPTPGRHQVQPLTLLVDLHLTQQLQAFTLLLHLLPIQQRQLKCHLMTQPTLHQKIQATNSLLSQ
eukprot:65133_1